MDLESRTLEVAAEAAEMAGKHLLKLFRSRRIHIRRKFDYPGSIVTNADKQAESIILRRIRKSNILSTIISEEAGTLSLGSKDVVWAVDPLDGTLNFVKRIPHFAVSIGAMVRGRTAAGVVYNPVLDEMFAAKRGEQAMLDGQPIHVSRTRQLKDAALIFEWWKPEPSIPKPLRFEEELYRYTRCIRSPGSVALNLCSVACGKFDGMVTVYRKAPLYEIAAGCLIAQEAGGVVTNSLGKSWETFSNSVIAGGRVIHNHLLSLLRG